MDILERKNLRGANLIGANLQGADLQDADLGKATLQGADLRGANLQGADLRGTDFSNAHRPEGKGADMQEATLRGSNLYITKNLTLDQLSKVKTLHNAKLDEELLIPLKEKYPALFEKPYFEDEGPDYE